MIEPRKLFGGLGNRMFQGAYIYAKYLDREIPDIYLQDCKYFERHQDIIKRLYGQNIEFSNYVSLHIRRGDYINNPFYVDLTTTDYYQRAIAEFPRAKFLVFCADRQEGSNDKNDQRWCVEFLVNTLKISKSRFKINCSESEIEDMNRMAGCQGHIMANSSFSWWASFIGEGRTIAPKLWFTDGNERVRLLDEWIKI